MSGFSKSLGTTGSGQPAGSGFTKGLGPRPSAAQVAAQPKKHRSWWHTYHVGPIPIPLLTHPTSVSEATRPFEVLAAPLPALATRSQNRYVRGVGNVGQAIGASPISVAAHPKAATKNLEQMAVGLAESPFAIGQSIKKVGFMATMHNLWLATKKDYQARYGANWRKEASKSPLFNLADALIVLGPATKIADIGAAASRLGEAGGVSKEALAARGVLVKGGKEARWENLTPREKLRIAREESKHPGMMTRGEPDVRTLKVNIAPPGAEPKYITSKQALSGSPLRRTIQHTFDDLAQRFPEARGVGAKSRIMRAQTRQRVRVVDRALSSITDASVLKDLPEDARTRAFWESQLPPAASHAEATEKLTQLRSWLADEYRSTTPKPGDDPAFHDWLLNMKQAGFGDALLKRLDQAIKYTPGKKYERAMGALHQMTNLGEGIIHDTRMFTPLINERTRTLDQIAMLEKAGSHQDLIDPLYEKVNKINEKLATASDRATQMMDERRGLVSDALTMGTPIQAPERAAWEKWLGKNTNWSEQEVQDALTMADQFAHGSGDAEGFWRNRVGMPSDESAKQFMARVQTGTQPGEALLQNFPPFGETKLIEGDVMAPAETTAYYSRLQREVSDAWGNKPIRQAGQVEAQLRKGISQQEFYNAGLDNFFNQFGKNDMISQAQLQEHLASPLNAYNLVEHHRVNDFLADEAKMGTLYGGSPEGWSSSLLSREPELGEYHEITFSLPGQGRDVNYVGTGLQHWEKPNVVGHVRFQVFEEDGVRKLLIEEIQSDWASDARRAAKAGREYRGPMDPQEWEAELNRLEHEMDRAPTQEEADRIHDMIIDLDSGVTGIPPSALSSNHVMRLATNRVLRHAAENGVDQVIVVDRHVQHIRNTVGGMGYDKDWEHFARSMPTTEARAASLDLMDSETAYSRMYEQDIPKQIRNLIGSEGRMVEDAYQGHYATQHGARSPAPGDMAGTVFDLNDEARAAAMKPTHLYQRQPEWGKLPRGANELLAGGNQRVIHLFQKADISTWIHELSHSAVWDLAAEDQAVLDRYYGAGATGIDTWDNAAHENFARDFEKYVREGRSPHKLLTAVFERIQFWMQDMYRKVKGEEPEAIPPHVEAVFRKMLRPDQETPRVFMPHRALPPDLAGARMASGIPRASRTVGDRVDSRYPLFKENRLALLRSGLINDDPRLLVEHVNRLVSLQRANQLREFVLENATPLDPAELPLVDFNEVYVVKETGTNPHKVLFDAIEGANNPEEVKQSIADFVDTHIAGSPAEMRKMTEAWTGEDRLYTIDKRTVDLLFKNATGRGPGATTRLPASAQRIIDTGLNASRAVLLYGNPGFYVANLVGNFGMMMFNDPRSISYLVSGVRKALKGGQDPVYERVVGEMGRGPTAGGLREPEKILMRDVRKRPHHALMNGVERVDYGLTRFGHKAGSMVDNPFRYAAWRKEAEKRGYKTDAQVTKLLDQAKEDARTGRMGEADSKAIREVNVIRDKAEQLMLDFDSLSPTERDVLSRWIFLYPFLKASAKYPVMYAGEHPFTFGAAAQASNVGEQFTNQLLGPRPNLPEWAQGYARTPWGMVNIGSIDQMNVLAGELQAVMGLGRPTPVGINRAFNFIPPLTQLAVEMLQQRNRYGREANWAQILSSDAPLPNYITQLWRKPSSVYSTPSDAPLSKREMDALIRSLRLIPFGTNPNWQPGQGTGGG